MEIKHTEASKAILAQRPLTVAIIAACAELLGVTSGDVTASLSDEERASLTGGESIPNNTAKAEAAPAPDVTPFKERGMTTAVTILSADRDASKTKLVCLIALGEAMVHHAAYAHEALLLGFAEQCKTEGMGDDVTKQRKAEVKCILDAFTKATAEGDEASVKKLGGFVGNYHDFITLCREVRGKQSRQASNAKGEKSRLSDKEMEKAQARIKSMSNAQSLDAVGSIVVKVMSSGEKRQAEVNLMRLINNQFLNPLMKSDDKGIAQFAQVTAERIAAIITAYEQSKATTDKPKTEQETIAPVNPTVGVTVPTPAMDKVEEQQEQQAA